MVGDAAAGGVAVHRSSFWRERMSAVMVTQPRHANQSPSRGRLVRILPRPRRAARFVRSMRRGRLSNGSPIFESTARDRSLTPAHAQPRSGSLVARTEAHAEYRHSMRDFPHPDPRRIDGVALEGTRGHFVGTATRLQCRSSQAESSRGGPDGSSPDCGRRRGSNARTRDP
jgi:hypothetical protein